jgi:hypothetical protein
MRTDGRRPERKAWYGPETGSAHARIRVSTRPVRSPFFRLVPEEESSRSLPLLGTARPRPRALALACGHRSRTPGRAAAADRLSGQMPMAIGAWPAGPCLLPGTRMPGPPSCHQSRRERPGKGQTAVYFALTPFFVAIGPISPRVSTSSADPALAPLRHAT